VLSRLPEERLDDLVYVTFTEPGLMPKWNPFAAKVPPGKFADDFTRALVTSGEYLGPQMAHVIRNGAYTVHVLGGCLDDFTAMLLRTAEGEALIQKAMKVVENPTCGASGATSFAPTASSSSRAPSTSCRG